MKVFTEDELREAVMNYPGGCEGGKKEFLRDVLQISPGLNLTTLKFTITIDVPEESQFLGADGIGRVIQNGFYYERRDRDMWEETSWPLDGGNLHVDKIEGPDSWNGRNTYDRPLDANRIH